MAHTGAETLGVCGGGATGLLTSGKRGASFRLEQQHEQSYHYNVQKTGGTLPLQKEGTKSWAS